MSIIELVNEEAKRFYTAGYALAHNPEYLFLGHVEYRELCEVGKQFCVISTGRPPTRFKFNGMLVFEVDADHHVSFGYAQPSPCG